MHELGLCEGIVEAVERRAAGRRVARVRVRIGALHQVVPSALDQAFELVAGGTTAEGAAVDLVVTPVRVGCRACGHHTDAAELPATSSCSSPSSCRKGALMCLGIPGEVIEVLADRPDLAKVDVSGVKRAINIGLLAHEQVDPGDWVLIHVGFALSKIDEAEAKAALEFLEGIGQAYADELRALQESRID
jgi:hydrogenase expression/formation protein HypC